MKMKLMLFSFVIAVASFAPTAVFAQEDEDVRGAFLTTRPKATPAANKPATTTTTRPSRKRPKAAATNAAGANVVVKKDGSTPIAATPEKLNTGRIGLGRDFAYKLIARSQGREA